MAKPLPSCVSIEELSSGNTDRSVDVLRFANVWRIPTTYVPVATFHNRPFCPWTIFRLSRLASEMEFLFPIVFTICAKLVDRRCMRFSRSSCVCCLRYACVSNVRRSWRVIISSSFCRFLFSCFRRMAVRNDMSYPRYEVFSISMVESELHCSECLLPFFTGFRDILQITSAMKRVKVLYKWVNLFCQVPKLSNVVNKPGRVYLQNIFIFQK